MGLEPAGRKEGEIMKAKKVTLGGDLSLSAPRWPLVPIDHLIQ